MPVSVGEQNGETVIRFKNHPGDQNPSTICMGQHRKLLLAGQHNFDRDFYLPDNLTAEEVVRHVQLRCGALSSHGTPTYSPGVITPEFKAVEPITSFAELRQRRQADGDVLSRYITAPLQGVLTDLDDFESRRTKLRIATVPVVRRAREMTSNYVIRWPEGIAKSTAHFSLMKDEAILEAMEANGGPGAFLTFATRSEEQAIAKAQEYRDRTGGDAVVISTFRRAYERACAEEGEPCIPTTGFKNGSLTAQMKMIFTTQPRVYRRMEEYRKGLWGGGRCDLFDCGNTVLFMTHSMARHWNQSRTTRAWLHPQFCINMPDEKIEGLRSNLALRSVVYDEIEADEFINILSSAQYDLIMREQKRHHSWRDRPRHQRLELHASLCASNAISGRFLSFEEFDSQMRLNLDDLELVEVDSAAIPFGYDNKPGGLYNGSHGKQFYLGSQTWFSGSGPTWGFLTTESLTSKVVEAVHSRVGRQLFHLPVPNIPGIHPIKVPLVIDSRAAADRPNAPKVSALANEICDANPNAVVIADGVKGHDRVLTFQGAKGRNGLEEKDIYIVLTSLAPAKYEELNVLGIWLGLPDVIEMHYEDQLNQAVGRNRGFRQSSSKQTRTVVVTSKRLYEGTVQKLGKTGTSRVQLYRCSQRHW